MELKFDNAYELCKLENEIHNSLKFLKYKPKNKFNGYNECYKIIYNEQNLKILKDLYVKFCLKEEKKLEENNE